MPTVEKVSGGRYHHRETGRLSIGDRADVSEELAAYLVEDRGDFATVEDEGGDDLPEPEDLTAEDGPDYTSIPPNLEDATYDELMEVARDQDVSGRSSMDKDELIDALEEE